MRPVPPGHGQTNRPGFAMCYESARARGGSVRHVSQKEAAVGSTQELARVPQLVLVSLEGARRDDVLGAEALVEVDEQLFEQGLVDITVAHDIRPGEQTARCGHD